MRLFTGYNIQNSYAAPTVNLSSASVLSSKYVASSEVLEIVTKK